MSENRLFDLSGKTAFVSGASRGLGQQFSVHLAIFTAQSCFSHPRQTPT